jgi:hypothetical protein
MHVARCKPDVYPSVAAKENVVSVLGAGHRRVTE